MGRGVESLACGTSLHQHSLWLAVRPLFLRDNQYIPEYLNRVGGSVHRVEYRTERAVCSKCDPCARTFDASA